MADFSRSHLYPESRTRVRGQISCPRCRVDPSHISRQFWEATRPQSVTVDIGQNAPVSAEVRGNGYPDLCPRPSSNSLGNQSSVSNVQQSAPRTPANYSHSQNSTLARPTDTHSTRSGETWRIRGVFDNHAPDVVHRRTESNPGPLPDVTRHSSTSASFQHTRMPSNSAYEHHIPRSATNCSRYPDSRNRSFTASGNVREQPSLSRSDFNTSERRSAPPHWKREQERHQPLQDQCTTQSANPWVTRNQHNERSHSSNSVNNTSNTLNSSSSNSNNNNNNSNANNSNNISTQASGSNCWRSSVPQHSVLSQCPLPDLVTPRRQARKQCCGILATHSVAVRWLVVVVASLGLLCSIVGTVVGVVRATGKEHLSIALLLIGLGIVLVSMSGIAWRLTSRDAPSCRAMFGFRRARNEPHRRFVPRVPHYGRPHPFSAMLYPDIPLRPPPPSYQASMQEYRLRLLLMDRPQMSTPPPPQHPPPPPPTYRGPATVYPRFPINIGPSDYSRPPSYRSRPPSSVGQPSPLGPEDVDLNSTSNTTTIDHHNNSASGGTSVEVIPPTSLLSLVPSASSANQNSSHSRPAPSGVNHVEVVAQV